MHTDAYNYVFSTFHDWRKDRKNLSVLEIGSLDINGSIRDMFNFFADSYLGIDVQDGPGVDLLADGATYSSPNTYDVIVTAETFEHTPDWKQIIRASYTNLKDGGIFIATMAGEGRPVHSALDEKPIREWEHYANIGEWDLKQTLKIFKEYKVNTLNNDLRCFAVK